MLPPSPAEGEAPPPTLRLTCRAEIDPTTGEFAGNFPQAFSHIGIIASGVTLARAEAAR